MISIVVPVYNEQESLEAFYRELKKEMTNLSAHEIIFIDDGSVDDSLSMLQALAKKDKTVRVFSFRKNQGKAEALTLGFQKAQGEYIATLDADLQDRPEEIKHLLQKLQEEKWDVVSGWRKDRKDASKMVLASKLFNKIAHFFWGVDLHDYNCGLKVYTADAAKSLRLYGGFHRFIPLIASQNGFSVTELPVVHQPRKYGTSKYGFSKVWKDIPDLFTMLFIGKYSKKPLHFFGTIGMMMLLLGVVIFGYLTVLHFMGVAIGRRPLLLFSMMLLLGGLQVFFTGFLAELIISLSYKEDMHFPLKYSTDKNA